MKVIIVVEGKLWENINKVQFNVYSYVCRELRENVNVGKIKSLFYCNGGKLHYYSINVLFTKNLYNLYI